MRRKVLIALATVGSLFVVSACSDDDGGSESPTTEVEGAQTATTEG